ncbi:MAG: hypothetical protein JNN27_16850 [Planctomycetes bacterium]|nr:hypothetical protein [Planctomycetota bacterium]
MIRIEFLLAVFLCWFSAAPGQDGAKPEQEAPLVRCGPCKNEGRVPCAAHPKHEMHLEDDVELCSVVADCTTCTGTGWLDCAACENPRWTDVLELKRSRQKSLQTFAARFDAEMKRPLRKVVTPHVMLVWEVDELKVDKRTIKHHELMHLYAARLEKLFADYTSVLKVGPREFKERMEVFVWATQRDQEDGSTRFAGQHSVAGVKLLGNKAVFSLYFNRATFRDDDALHRGIVHNVTHLLLSHQEPSQWLGNVKSGWLDEGLAHWFEERYWGLCDNYCYEEQNTLVSFKGGKWKPIVRKMVETGDLPSMAEVMQQNTDGLSLPMHALAFSYVDFLIATDAPKLNELARQLRRRAETRDALQRVYKLSVLELEQQWKAWVVANYPLR